MKNTLIIGASGQIGKKLTTLMLEDGQRVTAMVRDTSKLSDLHHDKLSIIEADLTNDFSHAFKDCTNVVFVAGSGGSTGADKTMMIDLWSACKAADYAKQHSINHFLLVSSIGADAPDEGPEEMQPYLVAKHMADEHLMRSGLHYTIMRPGSLTDDDATGEFTNKRANANDDASITRSDVAKALLFCTKNISAGNTVFELFNGDKSLDELFKE